MFQSEIHLYNGGYETVDNFQELISLQVWAEQLNEIN